MALEQIVEKEDVNIINGIEVTVINAVNGKNVHGNLYKPSTMRRILEQLNSARNDKEVESAYTKVMGSKLGDELNGKGAMPDKYAIIDLPEGALAATIKYTDERGDTKVALVLNGRYAPQILNPTNDVWEFWLNYAMSHENRHIKNMKLNIVGSTIEDEERSADYGVMRAAKSAKNSLIGKARDMVSGFFNSVGLNKILQEIDMYIKMERYANQRIAASYQAAR